MPSEFPSTTRRRFLAASATAGAVGFATTASSDAFDLATEQPSGGGGATVGDAVRPFKVNVPEATLADMRRRIKATRFPTREIVKDSSQGVQLETTRELARYWGSDHDWRKVEA